VTHRRADFRRGLGALRLTAPTDVDDDAAFGQTPGDFLADAGGTTGDEGDGCLHGISL
jgi:hypothetical protein